MGGGHTAERPLISLALQNKDQLGLTPDQVKALESLRSEFQKEAIRRSADVEIAETSVNLPRGMGGIYLYAGTAEGLQRSADCF